MDDRVSTTGDSALGGVIATEQGALNLAINDITGTLSHVTGSTNLNTLTLLIVDADGPAADGSLRDGSSDLYGYSYNTGLSSPYFSATYQYVAAFNGSYISGGNVYNVLGGTYGVVTGSSDIPNAGTATYSGEAGGKYAYLGGGGTIAYFLTSGDTNASANFASKEVSVTMNNFTALDAHGTIVTQDVFDEVRLTNMSILGNAFSNGNIAFYKNGAAVSYATVIGTQINALTGGNFYGYDPTIGAPDEIGGVLVQDGTQGSLNLIFVAD